MGGKVFVYFITKLPRMEGGTSYVGFLGGEVIVGFKHFTTLEHVEMGYVHKR